MFLHSDRTDNRKKAAPKYMHYLCALSIEEWSHQVSAYMMTAGDWHVSRFKKVILIL